MVNAFCTTTVNTSFRFDPIEVDDGKFWSREEIACAMCKGILTPNFEKEYQRLLDVLPQIPHIIH